MKADYIYSRSNGILSVPCSITRHMPLKLYACPCMGITNHWTEQLDWTSTGLTYFVVFTHSKVTFVMSYVPT